jgi:hypothetical protein
MAHLTANVCMIHVISRTEGGSPFGCGTLAACLLFLSLQFSDIINACLLGVALLFPTIPPTSHSSLPPSIQQLHKGFFSQLFEVVLVLLNFHLFQSHITID